ncbi:hypothetical protein DESC_740194 [Desulfosarcina cetonica]|nr:hypothetical protein DESC_740194 [Desulfosarcina cetonica]
MVGLLHLVQALKDLGGIRRGGLNRLAHQLDIHQQRHQGRVDLVTQAAGHLFDGFQLLQLQGVGDIVDDALVGESISLGLAVLDGIDDHIDDHLVGHFPPGQLLRLALFLQLEQQALPLTLVDIGIQDIAPLEIIAKAQELQPRRIEFEKIARLVHAVDHVGAVFQDAGKLAAFLAELHFTILLVGNIDQGMIDPSRHPAAVLDEERIAHVAHPAGLTAVVDNRVFDLLGFMGVWKTVVKIHDPRQMVRMDEIEQMPPAIHDLLDGAAQQRFHVAVDQQDIVAVVWRKGDQHAFRVVQMAAHATVRTLQFDDPILEIGDIGQAAKDSRIIAV